jgi:zinc-finger binding domain of transposase IS66/Transposase IS116/IS110/IS902 family/Transposase C of IS166 homeodomain
MDVDLAAVPDDVDMLQQMVRMLAAERAGLAQAQAEIERLRLIIRKLQRNQFGRRAESLDDDQLRLGFDDLEADVARAEATLPSGTTTTPRSRGDSPRLPDHLERVDHSLDLEHRVCPCCGGALHAIGETISEVLDHVPARLRVIRIRRARYGCRACGTIHQVPAPHRPIAKGRATPALLAHVLATRHRPQEPILYDNTKLAVAKIGPEFASVLWQEGLYRRFANRRQLAAYAGLAPSPWRSGDLNKEQGISKSGNARLRTTMIEAAWLWLRHQPKSALSLWFKNRVKADRGRHRRVAIVPLARKLLIAFWHFATDGEIPEGAELKIA